MKKKIAIGVVILTAIILLHNLYLYETDYGMKVNTPMEIQPINRTPDLKIIIAVLLTLNILAAIPLILKWVQDHDTYNFKITDLFDLENYDWFVSSTILFVTGMLDGIVIVALLGYLIYNLL